MKQQRQHEHAFTLIELLIACFIILLLASLLVPRAPRFINALYQTRAVNDIRATGTTWGGCSAGRFAALTFDPLDLTTGTFELLTLDDPILLNLYQCGTIGDTPSPSPLPPELDPWGNPYRYYVTSPPGTPPNQLIMLSCGADGVCDMTYNSGEYPPAQTVNDIVWQNDCFFYVPGLA